MEKKSVSGYRWIVLGAYMLIAALTQMYWLNFASIDTFVEKKLAVSAMRVGWLALVFPLMYVFLSIPSGFIIDKKGYRFSVGLGAVLAAVFATLRLLNPASYTVLLLSQIGISLGQPFVLNGVTKLAVGWFPEQEEATAVGLGSLALFIGMIVGLGGTPALVHALGFEKMLLAYAGLGIVGVIVFLALAKPCPLVETKTAAQDIPVSYFSGVKNLFKMRDFVLLGFIALIGIGTFNGLATWLEKILNEFHGISMTDAGTISGMLVLSGMVGCLVIPLISDSIRRRKPFIILASVIGMAGMMILLFGHSYRIHFLNSLLIGFFLISALPIMLTMSAEITGAAYAGVSVAYLQLLGNGAAVGIVPIMEMLHKSAFGYSASIVFLIGLLSISFLLALFLRETAPIS